MARPRLRGVSVTHGQRMGRRSPEKMNDVMVRTSGGNPVIKSPIEDGCVDAKQPKSATRSNRRS